jgi:hypothetical protein
MAKKATYRSRVADVDGSPHDLIPVHVPMPRIEHQKFTRAAEKHPIFRGKAPLIRALIDGWMRGDIKL